MNYHFFKKLTTLPFIDEIWLYGSRARGDFRDRSDYDIAIICPSASDADWLIVMDIIDTADTLYKIDCIRFDTVDDNEPLKEAILRDKKIIFKRESL